MGELEIYLIRLSLSKKHISKICYQAKRFQEWCNENRYPLTQTDYKKILEFIQGEQQRGLKQNSIQKTLIELKHYFDYLKTEGLLTQNPTDYIKIQGVVRKKLHYILSFEELRKVYLNYSYPANKDIEYRDKSLLGLILFQGVTSTQLEKLSIHDLRLRTGKVRVPGSQKTNARWLKLESEQLLDLMTYRIDIRPKLIEKSARETDLLFFTPLTENDYIQNKKARLIKAVRKINRNVTSYHQIRASLITHWVKTENLRTAQYRAGHRFISSTEAYQVNDLEGLQSELEQFYPK